MNRAIRPATLVVIEFSASFPKWIQPTQSGDMAVVAQHYEGHPSSLVTQVATRTTRLEAVGWTLNTIVLVSNGRVDAESLGSRSILARGLLSRLRAKGGGSLVLTVDDKLGRRAVSTLLTLGESLRGIGQGAHLGVVVRGSDETFLDTRAGTFRLPEALLKSQVG